MLAAQLFILFLQLAVICGAAVFIGLAFVHILSDAVTDVPFVRTRTRAFERIASALDIRPGDTVYELGSGDGSFLLWCARRFPGARFVGIELNPLLIKISRYRARRDGSTVEFRQADLFDVPLHDATKIYSYLLTPVMNKLLPKLEAELRGVRLASCAFKFADKDPVGIVELSQKKGFHGEHLLYLYEF